ncbi:hypothetical protein ACFL6Y_09190 [Elusimicrobiota bacterium]
MDHNDLNKEDLVRHVELLNREISKLQHSIKEADWVEGSLKQRTQLLNERIKELDCVYRAFRFLRKTGMSWSDKVQSIVDILPEAWQHSRSACARAIIHGREFATQGFQESAWAQTSTIRMGDEPVGSVDVRYLKKFPDCDEGPFLRDERALLDVVAECFGTILEIDALLQRRETSR